MSRKHALRRFPDYGQAEILKFGLYAEVLRLTTNWIALSKCAGRRAGRLAL